MAKITDREWRAFVRELRGFKAAKDRHHRESSDATGDMLDRATAALIERVGEGEFPSIVACLDMRGSDLIERMAALFADEFPDLNDFQYAIEAVEARELFDECIGMDVEPEEFLAVLHGYLNAKQCGQDLFAEHGQDGQAVIQFLLDHIRETRREGDSLDC